METVVITLAGAVPVTGAAGVNGFYASFLLNRYGEA
jgi:hypothetical protein